MSRRAKQYLIGAGVSALVVILSLWLSYDLFVADSGASVQTTWGFIQMSAVLIGVIMGLVLGIMFLVFAVNSLLIDRRKSKIKRSEEDTSR